MSSPGHPPDLRPWLARLQAAGLADDATQLLDALWLSRWLPGPGAATPVPAEAPSLDDKGSTTTPAPSTTPPTRARPTGPEVEVPLPAAPPPPPPAPAPADAGVYARAGAPTADDAWRARALRVAGVPALRDGPALARALRPLGKRRRSATRFVIDEAATAERLADTGLLSPVLVPERERFFSATLLVEDSAAMPLWRGLADELETLLARQGGFRRFRRLALVTEAPLQPAPPGPPPRLQLRSRSGALQSPSMLLEDDASLVLIATDGTSAAWSDGRMAALAALLGPRTCVAALQWMPERLWPHSALGAADLGVQAPRPGAPLAELRLTRPRWLRAHRPVQPMPVAALTPASLGRLATMLMAKPGVRGAAALLWPATSAPPTGAGAGEEDLSQLTPEQRISRFRAVGSARLLQAAVQLSAAAPLTLPVVRLVHRVMQPGAPAEDLPLLLLGGLLQRQPAPPAEAAIGGDDDVVFDFAPGVRQTLQAALLKHEADAVRRAVSGYIAERTGSPIDLAALMRDDQGALRLPAWALPFAEVSRQVQALYRPPPAPPDAPPADAGPPAPSVREPQWAPGVTVQAETALPAEARKLAWSPDGQRLAVLHQQGLATFRLQPTGPGQRRWQREPLAMRGPSTVFLVQGFDVLQPDFEAAVQAFRDAWPTLFSQPLRLKFHTVGDAFGKDLRRRPDDDLRRLLDRVEQQAALMLCVGG
uniref:SAV_2336 N-terminal domain-related protein n=1 Tax=uncultured Aquincola sp. TaxID=886556 RepID=UPI0032B2AD83